MTPSLPTEQDLIRFNQALERLIPRLERTFVEPPDPMFWKILASLPDLKPNHRYIVADTTTLKGESDAN